MQLVQSATAHWQTKGDRDIPGAESIVIGAGPAGLAVAACLKQIGIQCLVLEQSDRVGSSWHRHYDRLHLHTDRNRSELPFMRFRASVPRYPSRFQFIDYLEDYARCFGIEPRFGAEVVSAKHTNGTWEVETPGERFSAPNLVIATGYNRVPFIADWPTLATFRGEVLHSSRYQNGRAFKDRDVLVVGLGNSGGEIAIDLLEHGARPSLSVRGPVNVIPRELFGIPILAIAIAQSRLPARFADRLNAPILRAVFGDLTRYGLAKPDRGPVRQISESGRIPLIDVGTVALIKRGLVNVYPAVEGFSESGVRFSGGQHRQFDAVILATGYRPQLATLLPDAATAISPDGAATTSGCESSLAGLYFCGFRVAATGMLREIALEAKRIAAAVSYRGRFRQAAHRPR
jgi:indole-3-pyruvate monooxygenase